MANTMKSKRITFVIEKLAQRGGGAERVLIDVANALADRGHDVEIVTHEYRGKPPAYSVDRGIILSNLRPPQRGRFKKSIEPLRKALNAAHSVPVMSRVSWLNRHGSFWRRLERHLKATNPDVVIAFMPPAIKALAYAKAPAETIKIASTHNAPFQDYENPLRWDPSIIDRQRRLECLSAIDKVLVLLPEYAEYYRLDPSKIVVMPNAVKPVDSLIPTAERRKVIAVSGRLEQVKRQDLAILAWKLIQHQFPDWSIEIYGEGSKRKELEQLILSNGVKRVSLLGHRSDAVERVASSAVLLHPASYEGFPLSVCEALAAGTPVIGFRECSGLNYLVSDGVNGLLSDGRNPIESLSLSLRELLENSALRDQLSKAGPKSVAEFSPESVIDQWERVFEKGSDLPPA
ncbi:MAG: hypothetical protein DI498_03525 [Paracoccus denitrificans]|nr:MAG: hypothetical protein DI498_03525 [Paracoccus denitrificans]PZO85594.1 MAG: hypothetical protein DI633_03525 [Paracoccus denitrificans]